MKLKFLLLSVVALAVGFFRAQAAELPQFSTDSEEYWYYLAFPSNGKVIDDMGDGKQLVASDMVEGTETQQWKLVGDSNDFKIVSRSGRVIYKDGPFRAAGDQSKGISFRLVASNVQGAWQVNWPGDGWGNMNKYSDTEINGWYDDPNDTNNCIQFLEKTPEKEELDLPLFSTGTEEHWYFISYANGGDVFRDNGNGQPLTHEQIKVDDSMLWKLVGEQDSFKLVSKLGGYVYKDGPFRTSTDPSKGFSLKLEKAGNPEFAGCLMINYPGDGWGIMNAYSNGQIDGYYNDPTDQNNALRFVDPSTVKDPVDMSGIKEFAVNADSQYKPASRHTLWYGQPATSATVDNPWMEYALPIGNGQFGGMVYGGIHCEELQFNDKSVWTGTSKRRGGYQNFGDLFIEDISGVFESKAVENYVRYLDMDEGIAGVKYSDGSVDYTREYIASYPDRVIAVRLSASAPGKLSLRLRLRNNIKPGLVTPVYADGGASFAGKLDLVSFNAAMKAQATGGTVTTTGDYVEIKNADEVLLLLAGGTDFDQHSPTYISGTEGLGAEIESRLNAAASKGWNSLLTDHQSDFKALFGRVDFNLADAANNTDTKSMIDAYVGSAENSANALMLEELYFNYGRYLLIGSSRGMDTPANLQGIWNNSSNPAWQSDIHSNINVQMNYWLAENTNLSELHMPYLNYVHSMALEHEEWPSYAQKSGQTKGWTCFTQNNIFGHSDYAENYVIANAWYTSHLWKHYAYTLDEEFLRTKAFPVMKSCSEFWMERLKTATDGTLVAPQEWSPEHGPAAEDGTAHAQQIVADLFESTLKAIEILGESTVDAAFVAELKDKYSKLDKGLAVEKYTGAWGSTLNGIATGTDILREWKYSNYSVGQNGHRHQSHLMAMYPFSQISPESEFFTPAVNSLQLRSDASTGWSLAWRVNLWARALDGNHAHKIIRNALKHSTSYEIKENRGGVYYNLLDSHAPFQIDGNFGYSAGVAEMLLQSYGDVIRLLPALPDAWKNGKVSGLRAEGNFTVDQEWADGKLTKAVVKAGSARKCTIQLAGAAGAKVTDGNGAPVVVNAEGNDRISFDAAAGGVYTVLPGESGISSVEADITAIAVENCIVTVRGTNARILAYDLCGLKVADVAGNSADLSAYEGQTLLIRAVADAGVKVLKVIL